MFAKLTTILIVGGTSGLGEAFAREFHKLGKKVIITGRRAERLTTLQKELPGLATYQWDVSDIASISKHVRAINDAHSNIDGVFLNSGLMQHFLWADPNTSTDESVAYEVTTNLTAPMVMMRSFVPDLINKAQQGKPVALLATTSGLAYIARALYPVYPGTKAAIHLNLTALRQQLQLLGGEVFKNFNVCEVAPPYVDTDLDANFRERTIALQGGPEKAAKPMSLKQYIDTTVEQLQEVGPDGKMRKETCTGFSELGNRAWRDAFDPIFENMGIAFA
ncbi:MAG: hypothetical protein Q9162_001936 [Coniocarpon cinnabarinum]